jgi:Xaa-Pro aminopeptidase
MIVISRLLLAVVVCLPLAGQITQAEYKGRRAALRAQLDGVAVVFGANLIQRDGFRQDPNFSYLTGWTESEAVLVMTPADEYLFLPVRNVSRDILEGRRATADDAGVQARSGFDKVLSRSALISTFNQLMQDASKVYTLGSQSDDVDSLRGLMQLKSQLELQPLIARQRMRKSPAEISLLQRSADLTVAAHQATWARVQPGLFEYQVAATLSKGYMDAGCERHAYAPTVGSGENSTVPHYKANRRMAAEGDLLLIDMGGECSGYASDITRTVPASGQFTDRQREVYNAVLAAQRAAIAAVRPGVTMSFLDAVARVTMNGLAKDSNGNPISGYMVHFIGHHVGLDVQDPADYSVPLEAGMVITVEPGVYLPAEKFGVRIEDVILVTPTGARVLSSALPKDADEIERLVGKN